ncbi:PepSY-associated TM helix domain-containing protein [Neptuniibacter halophilus]|uniref:PepSY-associated TM helix domain-containing protein n=1 Tax=Neptuniibacter halophilus TaxID=651666 RepID=UPI0025748492|nr:PepSY-associated TM helix domain-containing protein [Neptuniibacter halophilus]
MTTATTDPRTASVAKKKKRYSKQYLAYLVHSFVGLKLTLLLTVVLLTGALAVFQQELDWLIHPEMRAEVQEERLNAGELLDRLQAAYPDNGMFFFRSSENHPYLNAYARYIDADGGYRHAWIDPYSGEVKGDTVLLSLGQFLGFLHATLFLPAIGNSLVNGLGLLVLISLISGLIAVPKFWRYFFKLPRCGNLRVLLADLHRLVGLWSLWLVLIIGVTGSWWFYEDPFVKYFGAPELVEPMPRKPLLSYEDLEQFQNGVTPQMISAQEAVQRVLSRYPDWQVDVINPPEHNSDPYEVIASGDNWLLSEWRGNRVMVHPFSGEILETHAVNDLSAMQRTDLAMRPLHYGTWAVTGGPDLLVKTLYFIGGLGMTFLAMSGLLISYKRTRKAARKAAVRSGLSRKLRTLVQWVKPWGGPMGVFKYLNILALVGIIMGTGIALSLSSEGTKNSGFIYSEKAIGPWRVSMNAFAGLLEKNMSPIRPGGKTNLNVQIDAQALKAIKFLYVRVGKPRTLRAPGTLIHGPIGAKHVHLQLPKQIDQQSQLWLTAITWQGEAYQTAWSLLPDAEETIDAR